MIITMTLCTILLIFVIMFRVTITLILLLELNIFLDMLNGYKKPGPRVRYFMRNYQHRIAPCKCGHVLMHHKVTKRDDTANICIEGCCCKQFKSS